MCTASWSVGQGRLSLCFSRDERKGRSNAIPPQVLDVPGPKTIAAIDPDGGGTWLAVNEFGLCAYLLNNYAAETKEVNNPRMGSRSRGSLPLALTVFPNRREAVTHLQERMDFDAYNPFLIVVADTDGVLAFSWDGDVFDRLKAPDALLTTSSFKTHAVQSYRRSRYSKLLGSRESIRREERRQFHTELASEDAAFNPMMLREDSRTHSLSTVEIGGGVIRYQYEAVVGDTRRLGESLVVEMDLNGERVG